MTYKKTLIFAVLLPLSAIAVAQSSDFGIWATLNAEKQIGKWELGAEAELRTCNNASDVNRYSLQLEAAYRILKPLKAGIAYQFINFNDMEYSDYQPRQRYTAFLQARKKFGDFTFTLREQAQRTIKDERDRITESGNYDTYAINPEYYWRNRLKVSYNIPKFPVNPSFSIETFYQLNNPEGNAFDKLRYTLSFEYNLSKRQKIELYGLINKQIHVDDPVTTYVAGLGYTFSF